MRMRADPYSVQNHVRGVKVIEADFINILNVNSLHVSRKNLTYYLRHYRKGHYCIIHGEINELEM